MSLKEICSLLMAGQNKLECLSLATFFRLVRSITTILENITLELERFARVKHSSLFRAAISEEEAN
jgi:hypothetical protein